MLVLYRRMALFVACSFFCLGAVASEGGWFKSGFLKGKRLSPSRSSDRSAQGSSADQKDVVIDFADVSVSTCSHRPAAEMGEGWVDLKDPISNPFGPDIVSFYSGRKSKSAPGHQGDQS